MVPWRAGARMLQSADASGSGASESWPDNVAQLLAPETKEQYALSGGIVILILAVIACVMNRDAIAGCCYTVLLRASATAAGPTAAALFALPSG